MIVECPGCRSRYDVTGRPAGTRARCRCGQVFALPEPTIEAGELRCPGCGAAVPSTSHHCEYCRIELKVKACPRCFAQVFVGARHCDQCGAEIDVPARVGPDGTAAKRRCPRCEMSALDARLVGDVLVDQCPDCHGVWLDSTAVERVIRERRQASSEALLGTATAGGSPPATVAHPTRLYVKCPDCETVMNRVNFGRKSGIIIDTCRAHGTWFDSDELPAVVRFVMRGGLEEAERRAIEDLKEEARRMKADAESQRMHAAMSVEGHHYSGEFSLFGAVLSSIGRILRD